MRQDFVLSAIRISGVSGALTALVLALSCVALSATPSHAAPGVGWAAPRAPGRPATSDTLTLALNNGPSFVYAGQPGGTTAPKFTATLQLAAKPTANYFLQVIVTVGNFSPPVTFGNGFSPTTSLDGLTDTFTISGDGAAIPVGAQTAVATLADPYTKTTDTSNGVSLTITQATPDMQCMIATSDPNFVVGAGEILRVNMSVGGNPIAPVDWQHATYTVTFHGNIASNVFTTSGLVPDSNDSVTVAAPSAYDWYMRIDCTFNGTANFASATTNAGTTPILVSQKRPLGQVQLSSNPWPWITNQSAQVGLKFLPAAGGPIPDGFAGFTIGNLYTKVYQLDANGELAGTLPGVDSITSTTVLEVDYQGDPYYNWAVIKFPMNQPLPGSGGSGGGGTGGSSGGSSGGVSGTATGTPSAKATATPTPTPTSIPASTGSTQQLTSTPGKPLPWGLLLGGAGAMAGSGLLSLAGALFLRRRRLHLAVAAATPPHGESRTE